MSWLPKSLWLVALAAVLPLMAVSTSSSGNENKNLFMEVTFDPPEVRVQSGHSRVVSKGAPSFGSSGSPELPHHVLHVDLDPSVEISSVQIEYFDWDRVALKHPVRTAQNDIDAAAYRGFVTGNQRGKRVGKVTLVPYELSEDLTELRFARRGIVRIFTESSSKVLPIQMARQEPASQKPNRDHKGRLHPKINSGEPFHPTFRPSVDGSAVEMVIITDASQESSYEILADYRTKLGIPTVVRTTSWIAANYARFEDEAASIRGFIREAVELWGTEFVLLGGDVDIVPIRIASFTAGSDEIPTDLYYTDLDGDWNGNGNATYGELGSILTPGDDLDKFSDVVVGRLPSGSASEADVMIEKTIQYAQAPPSNFAAKNALLGEVLFPTTYSFGDTLIARDGADLCYDLVLGSLPLPFLLSGNYTHLFENHTAWPTASAETKVSVLAAMNAGNNLTHFVGHGYADVLSVGSDAVGTYALKNSDIAGLTNGSSTPRMGFLFASTCASGDIRQASIVEEWLKNPIGGGVAAVSATHLNSVYAGKLHQDFWYDQMFTVGGQTLGEVSTAALDDVVSMGYEWPALRETLLGELYLGDPTLSLWRNDPTSLDVSVGSVELGDQSALVTVTSQSQPIESARVCLSKPGDAYAVGWTDSQGQVSLPFEPDETGDFTFSAWAADYIASIDTATVVPATGGANLFVRSQTIDDDLTGSSDGNADQVIDSGETIELSLLVENNGSASSGAATLTATSASPHLSIADPTSAYVAIASGQTSVPSDPLVLTVSRSAVDKELIPVSVSIQSGADVWTDTINLYVHAPILQYESQSISDQLGNGNGVIEPGESIEVTPTISNLGLGQTRGLEARLRSSDPNVTLVDTTSLFGAVSSGSSTTGDAFQLSLADTSLVPQLEVVFVDYYAEIQSQPLDLVAPSPPGGVSGLGGEDYVILTWNPEGSSDLHGYQVSVAADSTGPYSDIDHEISRSSYFRDDQLPALTIKYYKVAAVDSSGNKSADSDYTKVSTTLPVHQGFPVKTRRSTTAGITVADLDGDGEMEILTGGEELYVLRGDGTEYIDGDNDPRFSGPFSNTGDQEIWNTPAVADIDNDGDLEIAAATWRDAKLYVWDHLGNVLAGFPKDLNPEDYFEPNPIGSVSLGDVDANGDLEIFVQCTDFLFGWHHDGSEIADGDSDSSTDGVLRRFGSYYNYSTPSFGDFNGDVYKDIIATGRDGFLYAIDRFGADLPGFPVDLTGEITSSPVLGDVDGDGNTEIIVAVSENTASKPGVVNAAAGLSEPKLLLHLRTPISKNACSSPGITDPANALVQGAVSTGYQCYFLAAGHNEQVGLKGASFSVSLGSVFVGSWANCTDQEFPTSNWPASGESNTLVWDSCNTNEIAVAGHMYVYAYGADLLALGAHASGAAQVSTCYNNTIEVPASDLGSIGFGMINGSNPYSGTTPQPGRLHAIRGDLTQPSGWPLTVALGADLDPTPALFDVDDDSNLDVIFVDANQTLRVISGAGQDLMGTPFQLESTSEFRSSVVLSDTDANGQQEVFVGDQNGTVHGTRWNGTSYEYLQGFPIQAVGAQEGTMAISDLEADGYQELLGNSLSRTITRWDFPDLGATGLGWRMFKGSGTNAGVSSDIGNQQSTSIGNSDRALSPKLLVPNPIDLRSSTSFSVGEEQGSVDLFDVQGRLVWSTTFENGLISITPSQWLVRANQGVYFLRVRTLEKVFSQKVVILR